MRTGDKCKATRGHRLSFVATEMFQKAHCPQVTFLLPLLWPWEPTTSHGGLLWLMAHHPIPSIWFPPLSLRSVERNLYRGTSVTLPLRGGHLGHPATLGLGTCLAHTANVASVPNAPQGREQGSLHFRSKHNELVTTGKDAGGKSPARWSRVHACLDEGSQWGSVQLSTCSWNLQYSPVTNQNASTTCFFNFNPADCPRSRLLAAQVV